MKRLILLLMIVSVLLTGCWDQKVFEKIGFILQMGIESGKNKKLLVTYTSPVVGGEIKEQVEIVSVEGDLLRATREYARMLSPKTLEGGKIQQLLISNELAESGVSNLLDVLHREPTLPTLALVVIVDGSPFQMLKKAITFEDKPRAAFYINELLEGNIKSSYLPETRVWEFSTLSLAPGIDPIAPMLKLQAEGIRIIGSALFSGDKMVGKINTAETSLLLAMMNKLKATTYIGESLAADNEQDAYKSGCAVLLKKAKCKIDVRMLENEPVANITLKLYGSLDEYIISNITDLEKQKKLEQQLSDEIKNKCTRVVEYMASVGSDPLGIGDIVRSKYNSFWQEADWKETYKNMDFNISVDLNITQFGALK